MGGVLSFRGDLGFSGQCRPPKGLTLVIPLYTADGPLRPEDLTAWQKELRDEDILVVGGNPRTVQLIKTLKRGKIAVIRQSLQDLERDIRFLMHHGIRIDYVCYNPEGHPTSHTSLWEKEHLLEAVEKAKRLA